MIAPITDFIFPSNGASMECNFRYWYERNKVKSVIDDLVSQKMDAIWIRGRMISIIGNDCPLGDDKCEKTFMEFKVQLDHDDKDTRVIVTDYYGETGLIFENQDIPRDNKAIIANGLWKTIMDDIGNVTEYADKSYHCGAGFMMHYGIRDGKWNYAETDEE
jgi:hypothetical protein